MGVGASPPRPPHAAALAPSQVSVPPGALDCWVFLSCLEVLQRIEGCCDRAHLDANSAHTVGLWSYATEKVTAPDTDVALPVGRAGGSGYFRVCPVAAGTSRWGLSGPLPVPESKHLPPVRKAWPTASQWRWAQTGEAWSVWKGRGASA